MTDRPIIFSGPMVRALLDDRKKQTRRILKPQPYIDQSGNFCAPDRNGKVWNWGQNIDGSPCLRNFIKSNVRFTMGDRLWVREAFMLVGGGDPANPIYRANWREDATARHMQNLPAEEPKGWRPSIHMPRWASRLTLMVTEVRVERLNTMSPSDAIAEGIQDLRTPEHSDFGIPGLVNAQHPVRAFWLLWEHINGEGSWLANPWVVAVSFTVHRANIDALDIGAAA